MLRNVLGAYLDNVTERALDLPLMALLAAMGFVDIHYTHGQVEFGKDFIAKRIEAAGAVQYSFQSKAGDISQAEWRNSIQGQLLEAVLTPLVHPNFDASLPHQVVLVTTGDLRGNAALEMQSLNARIAQKYHERPILLWSRENLLDHFEQHGLSSVHQVTAAGLTDYAQFFLVHGRALQGMLSEREIEAYTQRWLRKEADWEHRLFRATIEAEMVAQQCSTNGYGYEAIMVHLRLIRMLLDAVYTEGADAYLRELYTQAVGRLHERCTAYLAEVQHRWQQERNLLIATNGAVSMTTYLVQCARIMDVAALTYFLTDSEEVRRQAAALVEALVREEPGCAHPLSDRYAISIVLATLILCDCHHYDLARDLLACTTIWLCDRAEEGMGLASFEANEVEETLTLLGYPFEGIAIANIGGSLLAAALCDLAAFVGDSDLYGDIVNDIKACHILPEYWQPVDSAGVCRIDGEDVIAYPNVRYVDTLTTFDDFTFADHIPHESDSFRIVDVFGLSTLVVLMVLLRDRSFPKLWHRLTPNHRAA